MFGKKADDKIAKKQAEQEAKDKAAMEKFGVYFGQLHFGRHQRKRMCRIP